MIYSWKIFFLFFIVVFNSIIDSVYWLYNNFKYLFIDFVIV